MHILISGPTAVALLTGLVPGATDHSSTTLPAPLISSASSVKEDDSINFLGKRSDIFEMGLGSRVNQSPLSQESISNPLSEIFGRGMSSTGASNSVPAGAGINKKRILGVDDVVECQTKNLIKYPGALVPRSRHCSARNPEHMAQVLLPGLQCHISEKRAILFLIPALQRLGTWRWEVRI